MQRLDLRLVELGLARSRTRAQRLIRNGRVQRTAPDRILSRPGEKIGLDVVLQVSEEPEERYVSRAGLKLEAALEASGWSLENQVILDIGQSTGGFTDCALAYQAAQVIGIEVGHAQLDPRLREDPRVICLEGVNARYLSQSSALANQVTLTPVDLVVIDVSFISQTLLLDEISAFLPPKGRAISLIKPQFELEPAALDRHGVVRKAEDQARARSRVIQAFELAGFKVDTCMPSPIQGGDGNEEWLLLSQRKSL